MQLPDEYSTVASAVASLGIAPKHLAVIGSVASSGANPGCYHSPMADAASLVPPESETREAPTQTEEYPYSDGRVLMEGDAHANSIVAMRNQLQAHFYRLPDTYVAGSMAVYYREGDREAVVEPDVFVVLGVERKDRRSYKIWEEGGVVPAFVVEVVPPSSARPDATSKQSTYEQIGVREYWQFDPVQTQIPHGLEGWRLKGGQYDRVRATSQAGGTRRYRSLALELGLRAEGQLLRFWDPRSGKDLRTHLETLEALAISERKAEAAAAARRDAERRVEADKRRTEEAKRRAEADKRRAEDAKRERDEANRRILELEARLRASGKAD